MPALSVSLRQAQLPELDGAILEKDSSSLGTRRTITVIMNTQNRSLSKAKVYILPPYFVKALFNITLPFMPAPWGPPSLLCNRYRVSFPGVKLPGSGANHPPPSSAEVKERIELYLYSPSGPLWHVLGRTLFLLYA